MDINQPIKTAVLANTSESASSMLKEIDSLRMAYIRNHTTQTGDFDDNVDPKVGFKVMDDLSKSLARREKQEAENLAEMNMDQHRARALALADELVKRQSKDMPVERHHLDLPTLPDIVDIAPEEIASGIVKLDLNEFRE